MQKENVHLKYSLWPAHGKDSMNSSRSRIPKFIQWHLASSNKQAVWLGALRRLVILERERSPSEEEREQAPTLSTAQQTDPAKGRGHPSPDTLHQEARQN